MNRSGEGQSTHDPYIPETHRFQLLSGGGEDGGEYFGSSHVPAMTSLHVHSLGQRSIGGAPTASPSSQSSRSTLHEKNYPPKKPSCRSNPGLLLIPPPTQQALEPVKDAPAISLMSMESTMPKQVGLNVGLRFGNSEPAAHADLYAYRPPQCAGLSRVITYSEDGSEHFQLPPSWIVLRPEDCPLIWIVLRSGTFLPDPDTYGTVVINWLDDVTTMTCGVMGMAPAISSLGAGKGLFKPPMGSMKDTHVSLLLGLQCGCTFRRWLARAQRMGIVL